MNIIKHRHCKFLRLLISSMLMPLNVGCTVQRHFEINIQVRRPTGEVVPRSRILKDGIFVGMTDNSGNFSLNVTTNCKANTKIVAQKDELESQEPILLPVEFRWECPDFMQGILVKAEVELALVLPATTENLGAEVSEQMPDEKKVPQVGIAESDLPQEEMLPAKPPELDLKTSDLKTSDLNSGKVEPQNENLNKPERSQIVATHTVQPKIDVPSEKSAESAKHAEKNQQNRLGSAPLLNAKHLVVTVFSNTPDKKIPLPDAEIFMGRNLTRTEKLLGKTDEHGKLEVHVPLNVWGETLILRHSCCGIRSQTLTGGRDAATVEFKFPDKKSREFHVMSFAYGLARGAEKVDVKWSGATKDVTGPTGLAVVAENNDATQFSLSSQEYIPSQTPLTLSDHVTHFYLAPRKALKPTIALLEIDNADPKLMPHKFGEDTVARLFRREFLAKFLQSFAIRPIIAAETNKMAKNAGVEIESLALKGWQNTPLESEWDGLLIMRKMESQQSQKSIALRLVNRMGVEMWKKNILLNAKIGSPEADAAKSFQDFMKSFPFEATVVGQDEDELIIGQGEQDERFMNIGDTFAIYAGESIADIPTVWQGKIKIVKIGRNESRGQWADGSHKKTSKLKSLIGARAVRVISAQGLLSTKDTKLK